MIISNEAGTARLNSVNNLFNKLKENNGKGKAMNLFGIKGDKKAEPLKFKPAFKLPEFKTEKKQESVNQAAPGLDSNNQVLIPQVLDAITIDNLLDNPDAKIKIEQIHNEALDALHSAVKEIKAKTGEVQNPSKLADIAAKMSKIVTDIRSERNKTTADRPVHLHFYTPERKKITDYEEVHV